MTFRFMLFALAISSDSISAASKPEKTMAGSRHRVHRYTESDGSEVYEQNDSESFTLCRVSRDPSIPVRCEITDLDSPIWHYGYEKVDGSYQNVSSQNKEILSPFTSAIILKQLKKSLSDQ